MSNQNQIDDFYKTSDDTKKLYRRANKALKVVWVLIIIMIVCVIASTILTLKKWNDEQLNTSIIQAPETHLATINGRETVIYTDQDGTRSASVSYEFCKPLGWTDNCRWDRENFSIKF